MKTSEVFETSEVRAMQQKTGCLVVPGSILLPSQDSNLKPIG
jgi:hypothetical protein